MKNEFYRIFRKDSCYKATLNFRRKKYTFTLNSDVKSVNLAGIAILGEQNDGKYTLYFPTRLKGFNSEVNSMYGLISDIEYYQYSSGLLIFRKDNTYSFMDTFDYYTILNSIMNNGEFTYDLEECLTEFAEDKITTREFNNLCPYIKGRYYEYGCNSFLVTIGDLDYVARAYETGPYRGLTKFDIFAIEGKAEYLIPDHYHLIKITDDAEGKEYIVQKHRTIDLYDEINKLEDDILLKMQPALGNLNETYHGYSFIRDGKIAKIAIYSASDEDYCYELYFEKFKEPINLSTLNLIQHVCFDSCPPIDIWKVDTLNGKETIIFMKNKDEQALVKEW